MPPLPKFNSEKLPWKVTFKPNTSRKGCLHLPTSHPFFRGVSLAVKYRVRSQAPWFQACKKVALLEPGLMEVWVSFALFWGRFSQAFEKSLTGTGTLEKESWCTCYIYIYCFLEILCMILCSRGTLFRHFAHTWINWWPGYHIWGICLWLLSGIQVF